jgi:hypothetical protein
MARVCLRNIELPGHIKGELPKIRFNFSGIYSLSGSRWSDQPPRVGISGVDMAKTRQEPRPSRGRHAVSVPSADVDLFRRVAAALAKDDHRAQRLRQAIQNAGSVPITFEEWLAAPGTTKQ